MYLPSFNTLKTALIAVAVAISALCLSGVYYSVKMKRIEAKHANQIEQVKADAAAAQAKFTDALNETHQQNLKITADYASASTAASGLRESLRRYQAARPARCGEGVQSADAPDLLSGLLIGLESGGREVSEYADRLKTAGALCEKLSTN
jgi:hypothetical protein